MAPTRIHHVNFIVRDLETATRRFEETLELGPFEIVEHAARGARVARSKLGDAWFVLVAPTDTDSPPGQFLKRHGEGFFLLSIGTPDLDAALARLSAAGQPAQDAEPREGILDWRVADVGEIHGALFQLAQDPKAGTR